MLSAFAFTCMNTLIKFVNELPTMQLVFFRSIGSVVIGAAIMIKLGIPWIGKNNKLLISRALVGMTSMAIFFKCLQLMPIASAVSLRYTSPIFAAILAFLFLKEKIKPYQWLCFLVAFIGVVLIKGFDDRISLLALVLIFTSSVLSGVVYVLLRMLSGKEHPVRIVNYFMITACVISGIWAIPSWVTPQNSELLILCSLGIFGFFGQYFMTQALQLEEASKVVPFKYSEAIFTVCAAWMIFGEGQNMIALSGMVLIIIALSINAFVKQKA